MSYVAESYEATRCKDGRLVFTFDIDDFTPAGDLVGAPVNNRGAMTLVWSSGASVRLPDVRNKLAAWVAAAPVISVRWVSDGLLRGADLQQAAA